MTNYNIRSRMKPGDKIMKQFADFFVILPISLYAILLKRKLNIPTVKNFDNVRRLYFLFSK